MRHPENWHPITRAAHGAPCANCGAHTYTKSGVCKECKAKGRAFADPKRIPEDYLMRCAEELLRRHNERAALLAKLGIGRAA